MSALDRPIWQLVLEGAETLSNSVGDFHLYELVKEVHRLDPRRDRPSIQPVVQGMTVNAAKGPPSPCGKPLFRVEHGLYRLAGEANALMPPVAREKAERQIPIRTPRDRRGQEVESRIDGLIDEFDSCIEIFDQQAPFTRRGQYSMHRKTIDRRRTFLSILIALEDEEFIDDLYATLQAWGIGRRASRLVPRTQFGECLRQRGSEIAAFENMRLEDSDLDVATTGLGLWYLIERLGIVQNKSLVVPGAKTLHHLLPDLLPPMDRAWTGSFFMWSATAPQSEQKQTFVQTFSRFARIAQEAKPATYVGDGWRTCSTKVVDNAIIGYCKLHGIAPTIYGKTVLAASLAGQTGIISIESEFAPLQEPAIESTPLGTTSTSSGVQQVEIESLERGHIEFDENERGVSYDYIFGPYVKNARMVMVVDPYIRNFAQARNLMEFIETVRKFNPEASNIAVALVTISEEDSERAVKQLHFLNQVVIAAASIGIQFSFEFDTTRTIHDREVLVDLSWKIVLGRGLDIFQPLPNAFDKTISNQTLRMVRKFNITYVKNPLARRMSHQRK